MKGCAVMTDKLLHTPDGVRDIYSDECENKEVVQDGMKEILKLYGFRSIQTPSFEFFDIFNKERGTVSSREMYKFFDRDGNTMALRPDITPSVARCVAKYYKDETVPIRFSYVGNTFINNNSYQGKLKEITQVGAELINDNSADADAEMIAICIECLLKAGLTEFQIDLGHADLFNGLMEETGFDEDEIMELKVLIEEKNIFGASSLMATKDVDENLRATILKLPEMFGNFDIIEKAKSIINNERAVKALNRLEKIYSILEQYGFSKYVSFDLGMLSKYNYYTGIIFKGYTYGTGDAIASGGRYDALLSQFGKDAPAIGLVILLDQLMIAMQRQNISIENDNQGEIILFRGDSRNKAIELAGQLRKNGKTVVLIRKSKDNSVDDYVNSPNNKRITKVYYLDNDDTITLYDIEKSEKRIVSPDEIIKREV